MAIARVSPVAVAALWLLATCEADAQAVFVHLGVPSGMVVARGAAASYDGTVVVGSASSGDAARAFRWTSATGFQLLPTLPDRAGHFADSASADGSTIVGIAYGAYGAGLPLRSFRWTASGGTQDLGYFSADQATQVGGVTADGSLVVGTCNGTSASQAFTWTPSGGLVSFSGVPPTATSSSASSVSADGQVILGGYLDTTGGHAIRWSMASGLRELNAPAGAQFFGTNGLAADGSVAVGIAYFGSSGYRPYRWDENGIAEPIPLPAGQTEGSARACSNQGTVIAGSGGVNGDFIWTATTGSVNLRDYLVSLGATNAAGWTLNDVSWVSPDGRFIVGTGVRPGGGAAEDEPFIATIPSPAGPFAFLFFALMMTRKGRARQ